MTERWWSSWPASVAWAAACAALYLSNRPLTGLPYDTVPHALMPWLLARGHGVAFDPLFGTRLADANAERPYFHRAGGTVLSAYPPGAALAGYPLALPQIKWLDATEPGWDDEPERFLARLDRIAKRTAAGLAALAALFLHRWLLGLGVGAGAATIAMLAAALGSELWAVASQAAWQHGPAALLLVLGGWAWSGAANSSNARVVAGSVAFGALPWVRLPDALLLAAALAWAWHRRPGRRAAHLLPALALVAGLLAYQLHYYGHVLGGQARLEAAHGQDHGVAASWTGGGLLGTLVSPNRGLFVFTPWAALAWAWLPALFRGTRRGHVARWLCGALAAFWLMVGSYSAWWAGHCFGPRYWTEVMPLFALPFAFGWRRAGRFARCAALALLAWSVAVQATGAFAYPTDWNAVPANVDRAHERLWDWRDTELRRCWLGAP